MPTPDPSRNGLALNPTESRVFDWLADENNVPSPPETFSLQELFDKLSTDPTMQDLTVGQLKQSLANLWGMGVLKIMGDNENPEDGRDDNYPEEQ